MLDVWNDGNDKDSEASEMAVSDVLLKAKLASSVQTQVTIKDALHESYQLTKKVADRPPSSVLSASLYSECANLGNLLRRLLPLVRDADTRAEVTEAIRALSSAQIAVLRNGAPPSEGEVGQARIKRDYEAYAARVKREPVPARGGLRRDL